MLLLDNYQIQLLPPITASLHSKTMESGIKMMQYLIVKVTASCLTQAKTIHNISNPIWEL